MEKPSEEVKKSMRSLLQEMFRVTQEPFEKEIEEIIKLGEENPLSPDEKRNLLRLSLERIKAGAERRRDQKTLEGFKNGIDAMINRIMEEK
jgi:hypothetical protein